MQVSRVDEAWCIEAPWLDEPVIAPTFEEAYWLAMWVRAELGVE